MARHLCRHGTHRPVCPAGQRGTAPAQLHQRPACRRGTDHWRGPRPADRRPGPAYGGAMGRADHRVRRRRLAGRPGRGPGGCAVGRRSAADRARVRDRPDHRQPEAVRPPAGSRQHRMPGHGGGGLRTGGRPYLAAFDAVGAGPGVAGGTGSHLHGDRFRRVLRAHRGGRRGPGHRDHLRQSRGGGRARRPRARRALHRGHGGLVRAHPGRIHPGHEGQPGRPPPLPRAGRPGGGAARAR